MTKRRLTMIISEKDDEEEIIFRRIDNWEVIPTENLEILERGVIEQKYKLSLMPSSIELDLPSDDKTNAFLNSKKVSDLKDKDIYFGNYCFIKNEEK